MHRLMSFWLATIFAAGTAWAQGVPPALEQDQANDAPWQNGWVNLQNDARQWFSPSVPRLDAVEVELVVANPGPSFDTLTLRVLSPGGAMLAEVERPVHDGEAGRTLFLLPPKGVEVVPGNAYQIQLSGGALFGWKYVAGGYEGGAATFNGKPLLPGTRSTFLFRTYALAGTTGRSEPRAAAAESAAAPAPAGRQTETDAYTRYELLAPETASFAIRYQVTATTGGARFYFNPIRKGSVASGESVMDAMTGEPLKFEVVKGEDAVKDPLMAGEDAAVDYIKVYLARPVPAEGQGRLLILKTYQDAKSYYREGDTIVFNRPLGVPRNSVVLPAGYELVGCNIPSQVLAEPDGRIAISFLNGTGAAAPLVVKARPGAQTGAAAAPHAAGTTRSWEAPFEGETERQRLSERARQDRDIVYFLQQPETHAFSLYHDYTESRPGADKYFNVVRGGSTVSNPSAYVLDTGEKLETKLMTGAELAAAKMQAGENVDPAAQVVVIPYPAVKAGQSVRLRISETYTAPASYRLEGDELVFDRSLGRARNAVVLPEGWYLLDSSIPAKVSQMADGRIRLDFWNGRPDAVDVLIKAKRRAGKPG